VLVVSGCVEVGLGVVGVWVLVCEGVSGVGGRGGRGSGGGRGGGGGGSEGMG